MTQSTNITDALCQLLDTGDEADRCYAARTLGVMMAEDAVSKLAGCLKDEDIDVCVDAAEALGNIGNPAALPALLEALAFETSGEVSRFLVQAIGRIGGEGTTEALIKAATERPKDMEWDGDWDTWWDVQKEAIQALGELGAEEAVETLIGLLDDDSQQEVETDILRTLAKIPGRGTDALIDRLQNQSLPSHSRRRAAKALASVSGGETVRALGRALKDNTPEVRAEAIRALATLKADRYFSAVLLMLRDPEEEVRHAAISAVLELSQIGKLSADIQAELISMLDDSSSQVRSTLFSTLIPTVGTRPLSDENLDTVLNGLNDKSAETASAACTLLGYNNDIRALGPLLEVLQNLAGHPMVRREAAMAIARLGRVNHEVMDSLGKAVGDRQQAVRLGALNALMEMERYRDPSRQTESGQSPFDIILSAVDGKIELAPERMQILEKLQENAILEEARPASEPVEFTPEIHSTSPAQPAAADAESVEGLPDEFSDYIIPPESTELPLPETAGLIVQAGEVKQAMSTLDAIAMDNVDTMLAPVESREETPLDQETREYLGVVEDNKEMMRRIRNQRNITPEQDVRRLAARILSESDRPDAIQALIKALNDDEDGLLRREAADAIGEIGLRNPSLPELMDAVGTLITQLAVGDMEQRVTCARALGNLRNRTAIQPLLEAMHDENENVRIQAINALAQLVTKGADPVEMDHMVVRNIPPLSVARKLLEQMDDPSMALRVATARALGRILPGIEDHSFKTRVEDHIIHSVSQWSGEEARPLGKVLREFDIHSCTNKLLLALEQADDSVKRSVYIEMLEELYIHRQELPGKAA